MRTDTHRYTEWQDRASGAVRARELYDHQRDAQENVNRAERDECAAKVEELSEQLNRGWQDAVPEQA